MRKCFRVAALLVSAAIVGGCGSSGGGGGSGGGGLEQKVGAEMGIDSALVHCTADGSWSNPNGVFHSVAECTFDDGTTKGCYDSDTGEDITIPVRETDAAAHSCDGLDY